MSSIMKVFLLVAAVMFCISEAQRNEPGQNCLCKRTRDRLRSRNQIKDIQIYQKTVFCDKVEIVVTEKSGLRFCLNPNLKEVQRLMASIINLRNTTATPGNSSLAQ